MLKTFCTLSTILILSGCGQGKYQLQETPYNSEQDAAVNFFKLNISTLERLTTKEEMLGYVLECENGYYHTTPLIGGIKNIRKDSDIQVRGCSIVASLHTSKPTRWLDGRFLFT